MKARVLPIVLFVASSFAGAAHAEQPAASAENRAAAETLFYAGRAMMDEGRIADACRKLEESLRLDPAPGTLLNMALCHEKEGRIASAWAEYKQAVADARRLGRTDREQVASEKVAALEPLLPKLVVDVPEGARIAGIEVTRNGSVMAQASWGTALPVDPGTVEIRARAPQRIVWEKKIKIDPGQTMSVVVPPLEIDQEAVRAAAAAAASQGPPPPPSTFTPRRTAAVVTGGVGLVAVGVGTYFGVMALQAKRESDRACPTVNGDLRCSDAGAAAMDQATTRAWIANVGIGVGAVAIATAVYLWLSDKHEERPRAAHAVLPNDTKASIRPLGTSLQIRF